jgi:hypothetical protein
MSFVMELFLGLFTSTIGYIFLWIKFRGKKSMKELRKEADENSFTHQGKLVTLFIIGIIMLAVILPAIVMAFYIVIRDVVFV